jgi:hypothetical protein
MTRPEQLRDWAKGSLTLEAGTELLLRGFSGRFTEPGWPWMMIDDDRPWIDFEAVPDGLGGLSGGEKRFLLIAASIGGGTHVALSDVIPGLDRAILDLVLAAMAHAAGSHQDSVVLGEGPDTVLAFRRAKSLHPWPEPAPAFRVIDGGKG